MTKITTATPSGDCPTWRQFLDEVTGGDKDCRPTCNGWSATR
jgi:putative DNA primase/helicase